MLLAAAADATTVSGIASYAFALGLTVAVVLVALLVNRVAPDRRGQVRRPVIGLFLYLVSLVAAAVVHAVGLEGWERNLRVVAELFALYTVISTLGVAIFHLFFKTIRIQVAPILADLAMGIAYLVAIFVVLRRGGLDIGGIVASTAVVTGILALSMQATLGNVIGGVALQVDQSVRVGDWIQLESGRRGVVSAIRWRHTVIETNDFDVLIVPNATLLASTFTILGKRDDRRVPHRMWVYFNVDFRYNPVDVVRIVEEALRTASMENVAEEPPPSCVCLNFAEAGRDSFGYYGVRYHIHDMRRDDPTSSRVRGRIYAALKRADIPLAVPATHVWVEQDTEERRERKRQREQSRRLKALRAVSFIEPLTDDEVAALADFLHYAPFAPGETITRQGAVAHYLYVLTDGEAEVRIYAGNKHETVATLTAPTFFGEMGLMTGEPRTATVVARTEVECYRLDKEAFHQVLAGRPEAVAEISKLLTQRLVELQSVREGLDAESKRRRMAAENIRVLSRIRQFFGLDEAN
jgi:small-conductance mechanosensitive channel/CRP-like cAMP-binding protein